MSKDIKIKRGLDIRLKGAAEKVVADTKRPGTFVIKPSDFHLMTPKMLVKEGERFQAGGELFHEKKWDTIRFVSPVSGTLREIRRGPKRVITHLVIEAEKEDTYRDFGKMDVVQADAKTIKKHLLGSGCWPFIKQRPYDIIANPEKPPRDIFISACATAPLAADYEFSLKGREAELQAAVSALGKLTEGRVIVGVEKNGLSPFSNISGIDLYEVSGPHPAGNVGTLINKIAPVNKGETVWTVSPQDLVIIGELLLTGEFHADRVVALAGSSVKSSRYFHTRIGAEVASIIDESGLASGEDNVRIISGNVLTGKAISPEGHLGYYDDMITIIPEGDDYEFFGWNKPIFNKISITRALTFSWLNPNREYTLNTNTNGEHRAFAQTGMYEQVFPLDIYPMHLLKACMVKDLDDMERLGLYEVAPEDFALTEFVCVSKQPHQDIIRDGLDLMFKEIG